MKGRRSILSSAVSQVDKPYRLVRRGLLLANRRGVRGQHAVDRSRNVLAESRGNSMAVMHAIEKIALVPVLWAIDEPFDDAGARSGRRNFLINGTTGV